MVNYVKFKDLSNDMLERVIPYHKQKNMYKKSLSSIPDLEFIVMQYLLPKDESANLEEIAHLMILREWSLPLVCLQTRKTALF